MAKTCVEVQWWLNLPKASKTDATIVVVVMVTEIAVEAAVMAVVDMVEIVVEVAVEIVMVEVDHSNVMNVDKPATLPEIAETDVARAVIVWTTEETIEETTDVMVVTDVVVVVAVENDAKDVIQVIPDRDRRAILATKVMNK